MLLLIFMIITKFKIKNLLNFKNQNKFDLSVDTKKDLVKISRIINSLEEKGKKLV